MVWTLFFWNHGPMRYIFSNSGCVTACVMNLVLQFTYSIAFISAFKFCLTYERKTEFRKLCDNVSNLCIKLVMALCEMCGLCQEVVHIQEIF